MKNMHLPQAAFAALLLAAGAAQAIDSSWTNTTASGNWSDGAKWSTNPDVPDLIDDIARITTGTGPTTLNQAGVVLGQLINDQNSKTWTINTDANNYSLTMQVSSGSALIRAKGGTGNTILTLNPNLVLASGLTVQADGTDAGSQTINLNGTLTGVGNVVFDLWNSGAGNNATRKINVTSMNTVGSLTAQGNKKSGDITTVGPVGSSVTTLTKTGVSTLVLTGANSYSGSTTVSGGTLQAKLATSLAGYGTPGNVSVASGATLLLNVGGASQWTAANIDTLRANATFSTGSLLGLDTTDATSAFTYSSDIGGVLGIRKSGANELILSGNNSFTGDSTVSAGTLTITSSTGLGTTAGATTVASGATLKLDGTGGAIAVGNEALTLDGTGVGGNGALRNLAGANSWTGKVASGGGATILVDSGSSLVLAGGIGGGGAGTRIATFKGAGSTRIKNVTDTAYGITVSDGTVTLEAGNTSTYDRDTTVSGGTLLMNGTLDSVGNGVTVGANGTLGGTGTISRAVSVTGTLAPGAGGVGTLTIDLIGTTGKVTLNPGAKLAFDLGAVGKPGSADRLRLLYVVAGDLTLNNNVVNFTADSGVGVGVYNLMAFYSDGGTTLSDTGKPTSGLVIGTGLEAFPGSTLDYSATGLIRLVIPGPSGTVVLLR